MTGANLTLAGNAAAAPPMACTGHEPGAGAGIASLDVLELSGAVFDLHAMFEAISARALVLEDEDGVPAELTEPIRRLCRIGARAAEQLATRVSAGASARALVTGGHDASAAGAT